MKTLKTVDNKNTLSWFFKAAEIAKSSTCNRRKCGCIIIKDDKIIGKGFNSPPKDLESQRRCKNHKKDYDIKVTDKTCCMHAEQRAMFDALKNNPDNISGSSLFFMSLDLYDNMIKAKDPYCTICSKMALDLGIKEFALWNKDEMTIYDTEEYNDISFDYKSKNPIGH